MLFRSELRLIAGLMLAMALSGPAAAQATNDVRCLLASNLFSKAAKEPDARKLAEAGKYFYLGRIYGRLNEQQIRAQMTAEKKTLTPANATSVMAACAKQMQNGAQMVERVGRQLAPQKK